MSLFACSTMLYSVLAITTIVYQLAILLKKWKFRSILADNCTIFGCAKMVLFIFLFVNKLVTQKEEKILIIIK